MFISVLLIIISALRYLSFPRFRCATRRGDETHGPLAASG